MNGYFWLAAAAMGVLALSLVLDDVLDVLPDDLGPDWLSLPVLAAVVAAFGLAAGLVAAVGGAALLAVPVGLAAGAGAGVLTARLVGFAMDLPTDPPVRHHDLRGRLGRVVTPVRPDQPGEVLVSLGGNTLKLTARSVDALGLGAEVVVVDVLSPTAVVVAGIDLEQGELPS